MNRLRTFESFIFHFFAVAAGLWSAIVPTNAQVNVTQYHNHSSRDGLYIDSAFTQSAAANLTRDMNFDGTIVGNVYAQPLYIEGGPSGPMIIAVTESNNVYALDAVDGSVIWQRNVGDPVTVQISCTKFDPMGITGTPIVDLASRALFFDAMVTPDGGTTIETSTSFLLMWIRAPSIPAGPWTWRRSSIQRHDLHRGDPTATTGARHRGQHSLCRIWEHAGLQPLSWLAGGSADR